MNVKVNPEPWSDIVRGNLLQIGDDPTVWRVAGKHGAKGGVVALKLEAFLQAAWEQGTDD